MSTETVDTCPTCGQERKKYWHRLTPGLVGALIKFRRAVGDHGRNSIHLRHDMEGKSYELTRDQWSNFTKLRFHGLVAKDKAAGHGYWLITARGGAFLRREKAVPDKVQTFNNHVVDYGDKLIKIDDVWREDIPVFENIHDIARETVPVKTKQETLFGEEINWL